MSLLPFSLLDGLNNPPSLSDSTSGDAEMSSGHEIERGQGWSWTQHSDDDTRQSTNQLHRNEHGGGLDSSGLEASMDSVPDPHEAIVGFPPGTLIEIYRQRNHHAADEDGITEPSTAHDESLSGTIVSSAPSGEFELVVSPPPDSHHAWVMSPHPQLEVQNTHSIATTESVFRNQYSLDGSSSTEDQSIDTYLLSLVPSTWMGSSMEECDLSISSCASFGTMNSHPSIARHERQITRVSFVNVADRLALPLRRTGTEPTEWYARFTEQDWMQFRNQADMVLHALEPTVDRALPALPPAPPSVDASSTAVETSVYDASEWLPGSLLCDICSDVIVGALTLSCGCADSTVCSSCWETHRIASTCSIAEEEAVDEDDTTGLDYVHVEMTDICSSCGKEVDSAVFCHALDVAILHTIKHLPEGSPVQQAYYRRLSRWRNEVERRIAWQSSQRSTRQDQVLAELIQEEEKYFWKQRANKRLALNRGLLFLGELTVCLAVATISALGANRAVRR